MSVSICHRGARWLDPDSADSMTIALLVPNSWVQEYTNANADHAWATRRNNRRFRKKTTSFYSISYNQNHMPDGTSACACHLLCTFGPRHSTARFFRKNRMPLC